MMIPAEKRVIIARLNKVVIFPCSSTVEQFPVKEKVRGSNPRGGARIDLF